MTVQPIQDKNQTPAEVNPFLPDIMQYLEDAALLAEIQAKLKALASGLTNTGNVMLKIMQIFGLYQQEQGAKINMFSDVANLENRFRNATTDSENDFNIATGGNEKVDPAKEKAAKDLTDAINMLEKALGGKDFPISGDALDTLKKGLDSIKAAFTDKDGKSFWGDSKKMAQAMINWKKDARKEGKPSAAMKQITDGFHSINQTVSSLSAGTNAHLQFTGNMYKQAMGMYSSATETLKKTIEKFINAQTPR